MNIFEILGFFWIVLTSVIGTIVLCCAAWDGAVRAKRQRLRGACEEHLDIARAAEAKFLERIAR